MKNLKNVLVLLSVLTISSCAKIKIKNQEHCGDAGPLGATCFNTLNDETVDLTPSEWDEKRFGMICTEADNYSDNIATIRKACRLCRCCSYDAKKKIMKFDLNVKTFKNSIQNLY